MPSIVKQREYLLKNHHWWTLPPVTVIHKFLSPSTFYGLWVTNYAYYFLILKYNIISNGLVQAVESYRLWPEGPGFESRSPRIAQARVRLATNTLPQTPHRAGALCTGYALFISNKHDIMKLALKTNLHMTLLSISKLNILKLLKVRVILTKTTKYNLWPGDTFTRNYWELS